MSHPIPHPISHPIMPKLTRRDLQIHQAARRWGRFAWGWERPLPANPVRWNPGMVRRLLSTWVRRKINIGNYDPKGGKSENVEGLLDGGRLSLAQARFVAAAWKALRREGRDPARDREDAKAAAEATRVADAAIPTDIDSTAARSTSAALANRLAPSVANIHAVGSSEGTRDRLRGISPSTASGRSATVESERARFDRPRSQIDPCRPSKFPQAAAQHAAKQSLFNTLTSETIGCGRGKRRVNRQQHRGGPARSGFSHRLARRMALPRWE